MSHLEEEDQIQDANAQIRQPSYQKRKSVQTPEKNVLLKMEESADALNKDSIAVAKEKIKEGTDLVTKGMKIIKVADGSEFGWTTVKEYEENDLVSDRDDERRLFRSEKKVERVITKARRARNRRERIYPGYHIHTNFMLLRRQVKVSQCRISFLQCFRISRIFDLLYQISIESDRWCNNCTLLILSMCIPSDCFID